MSILRDTIPKFLGNLKLQRFKDFTAVKSKFLITLLINTIKRKSLVCVVCPFSQ